MINDARFPNILTLEQLYKVGKKYADSPAVVALLDEIRRRDIIIRHAQRVVDELDQKGSCHSTVLDTLRSDLNGEPALSGWQSPEEIQEAEEILAKVRTERGAAT